MSDGDDSQALMEEMIMATEAEENPTAPSSSSPPSTWKLYDNPFYSSSPNHNPLPSFLCHRYIPPNASPCALQAELDLARARIQELKTQVESERRMRRKAESRSKRLARETAEERRRGEAAARLAKKLAEEVASSKAAMDVLKKDMEGERRMMRIAEVWREERVQMKLEEARILMQKEKIKPEDDRKGEDASGREEKGEGRVEGSAEVSDSTRAATPSGEIKARPSPARRGSPEPENPHIRRGIRGFVEEFPRAVRAAGAARGRQAGSNLECQRAQLRLLLRHKSPASAAGLGVAAPANLNFVV